MKQREALRAQETGLTTHRSPLKALTGIRFFAAFYVVLFHSRLPVVLRRQGMTMTGNFMSNGYLAVPLFFLLSGFILSYTYAGQMTAPSGARRFFEARFARLWPIYAISLLCSSVPSLKFPGPGAIVATLCMVQAWNPLNRQLAGAWNLVCWTLSAEAFFYLCFPALQSRIEKWSPRKQLLFVAETIFICLLFNSAAQTLLTVPTGYMRYLPLPVVHLGEFFAGMGMGNYFLFWRARGGIRSGGILRVPRVWTYLSLYGTVGLLCTVTGPWTSLVVIAFSALIFGLAAEQTLLSQILSTPAFVLGGSISYAMYLMQLPVKGWVNSLVSEGLLASDMLRLALNAVVLIVVSLILFKAVEDPARRFLRTLFAILEQRRLTEQVRRVSAEDCRGD